jgi:hypothetical protein
MSSRDLVDSVRSGNGTAPRRSLFDIIIAVVAALAVCALGYVAYGTWAQRSPTGFPTPTAASSIVAATWTEADENACLSRARTAAKNADTGNYMITNAPIAEGVPFLVTKVECQLTSKPARFCGTAGRQQLVAIVNDYIGRIDLILLGLAAQGAPMAIAGGLFGGEAAAGDDTYSSMKADTIAYMKEYDDRVVAGIRSLASKGIITRDEFRSFPFGGVPKRIEEMFRDQGVATYSC